MTKIGLNRFHSFSTTSYDGQFLVNLIILIKFYYSMLGQNKNKQTNNKKKHVYMQAYFTDWHLYNT